MATGFLFICDQHATALPSAAKHQPANPPSASPQRALSGPCNAARSDGKTKTPAQTKTRQPANAGWRAKQY
ncbi:hypothetical protein TMES_11020 [Thalassospira mesophila]|uniref:Uncharacterized protein n=1 Tax=Thalassospira mesophila TaxID=1293891 RepID=A0A1Y2L1P9_9PROT|nr:hypothetical protein TMES_11020 [Thalassospira mesophila]